MADHYYGVDLGHGIGSNAVTTGTSSTATLDVELRVLDGVTGQSKLNVIKALKAIEAHIKAGSAPE
jgi:hypothetical protein